MDQATEQSVALMMFIGIVGMLLLAVAVILFFLLYQRRLLQQQENMRLMEIGHQRLYLEAVIEAQEQERKRIAQDLHDGVGALLSASKLYVNRLPSDQNKFADVAFIKQETVGLLDETIDNIRTISRNLLPTSLERFGLIAAIEDLVKRLNDLGTVQIDFRYTQALRFDIQQECALFRIIQELLNNSLKYAEAKEVVLSIDIQNDQLVLSYQDNGVGFDIQQWRANTMSKKGLGLRGIQSRADVLQAVLVMDSNLQEGFSVNLNMTIKPYTND